MEKRNLGFCGVDCGKCQIFLATESNDIKKKQELADMFREKMNMNMKAEDINCNGCVKGTREGKVLFGHCQVCDVRLCAKEKNINTCVECKEYTCEKLNSRWSQVPAGAKENLEEIKNRRQ